MKILYFDCFSGISGDMVLGAFIDMGIDFDWLKNELAKVHLHGYRLAIRQTVKNGITATKLDVTEEHLHHHHHEHSHNTLKEILILIENSGITENAKNISKGIFNRLARAEAAVHGSTPGDVHFHEVGAVDSIVDIVGCAICVDKLNPDKIYALPMCDGTGFVTCQHGKIPIPVPAVCELVAERGALLQTRDVQGELITPTGAAILCELAESFCAIPSMKITAKGYGAGTKDFDFPNLLRVFMGVSNSKDQSVWLLETNLDDITGETLGFVMERLFDAGALDVYYTPIYMKKNRPAYMLSVICTNVATMENVIFEHTTTLGIRRTPVERSIAQRQIVTVKGCRFKLWQVNGSTKFAPEYEDVSKIAIDTTRSFLDVYNEMMRYAHEELCNK